MGDSPTDLWKSGLHEVVGFGSDDSGGPATGWVGRQKPLVYYQYTARILEYIFQESVYYPYTTRIFLQKPVYCRYTAIYSSILPVYSNTSRYIGSIPTTLSPSPPLPPQLLQLNPKIPTSITIRGMMSRKELRAHYAVSDKTFNNKLNFYLPGQFKGTKTLTPLGVMQISKVLGPSLSTTRD